jgi:hypothetical protein
MREKSETFANLPSTLVPTVSGARDRPRRYQEGSLTTERRKQCLHAATQRCPHCVWVYRFFAHIDGKNIRRKVIVGTVEQFPTKDDAKRASEHLRMSANAENPRPNVTMRGLIDRYIKEKLEPCLDVPRGGIQVEGAQMSWGCAQRYRSVLRNWILPRWQDYAVSDFTQPHVRTAVEEWFESLWRSRKNPSGLAPKYLHYIRAVMIQAFKFAVKWGYLEQNPISEKRVELPCGSTKPLKKAAQLEPAVFFDLLPLLGLREKVAVSFAGWLGPRGSESHGLKWRDLDLIGGPFRSAKE